LTRPRVQEHAHSCTEQREGKVFLWEKSSCTTLQVLLHLRKMQLVVKWAGPHMGKKQSADWHLSRSALGIPQ